MGANQSSRSTLGVGRHQRQDVGDSLTITNGDGTLNISKQVNNNNNKHKTTSSLSSSLRKSVSNALATNKSVGKSTKSANNLINKQLKAGNSRLPSISSIGGGGGGGDELDGFDGRNVQVNQTTDSYYVTSPQERQHVVAAEAAAVAISKSGRMIVPAASKANNYVCMQTSTPVANELHCREPRREGSAEFSGSCDENSNTNNNNNYATRQTTYGRSDASSGGHFYVVHQQLPVNPVKDGSFTSGGVQDHHHQHNNHHHNNNSNHHHHHQYNQMHQLENHNMGALDRSAQKQQQQQLHQQTATSGTAKQPFVHLSRAVNTKTKRVLNNSANVSMPNGAISATSYGRRQQYFASTDANNNNSNSNNGASPLSVKNSPIQKQQQQQQQPIKSTQPTAATSGRKSSYPYHCSDRSSFAHYSSPNLVYRSSSIAAEQSFNSSNQQHLQQTSSPLCHKQPQQQPQLAITCASLEDSENNLQPPTSSISSNHQYYLRNPSLLGPQQTDLDQHLQMNALQRRYFQAGQQQYQPPPQQLDFHQPVHHHHHHQQQQQQQLQQQQRYRSAGLNDQLTLDCRNYTRSHSFGGGAGSRTLDAGKKKNPLAALFQNSSSKNHSNTINLGRRNKSSILPSFNATTTTTSEANNQRSCPGSLKRIKPAPLTAQQASYEAMRTIDMYLIRQIARSCMDFEMEQKIDLEIRLRELAAQSMTEARDEIDVLEVEKSLLTSDQRMNCYASLLEERRKQLSNPSLSTADSGRGSKSGHHHHHHYHHNQRSPPSRPDVIGANGTATGVAGTTTTTTTTAATATSTTTTSTTTTSTGVASSPSFSSSVSNSQSPSKLSPVSGESANSPSFTTNSSQHSRQLGLRSQSSANNQTILSAKQRAKNKQREHLMQSITSLSNINCNMVVDNRASVSVSEIRIPLMWRDVDHFKNRGDYKRFAIFCLLKIDSQIYDTQLICDVDRQVTDVTFDDFVVFNEIEHNFELTLEVYTCVYLEHFSLSSTPRKLKEKLTSSVSRAMGRRLATQTASANYTKELQAYDKSYRFALIANATLRLSDASDSVRTYDLVLISPSAHHRHYLADGSAHQDFAQTGYSSGNNNNNNNNSNKDAEKNTLPLFGHFCCKLLARPDVFDKNIKTGYLRVAAISIPANNNNNNNIVGSSAQNSHSGSSDRISSSDSPLNTTNDTCYEVDSAAAAKLRSSLAAASSKMATLSMSTARVHWGLLRNFALYLWPIDDQDLELALQRGELPLLDNPQKPRLTLSIDKYTRLLRVSNSSLTIETDKGCFVLGAYCPETNMYGALNQADEIGHWLRSIEQLIYDSHIWGSVLSHFPPHTRSSTSTRLSNNNNNNNNKRTSSSGGKQKQHYYGNGEAVLHANL